MEVYIEDLIDYSTMNNWHDASKETEEEKWIKADKAMACLRASLPPVVRTVYKYSLGLSETEQKKPHQVIQALKEYYGASIGISGERQKFLRLLQHEGESIGAWESRVRNHGAQCEYEAFADELMRDQFIAGLVSEPLRVKLIGKGHRHREGSQAKVSLREVVEVAKAFEATTFTNQLMKTARGTQEQVNYNNKTRQNHADHDGEQSSQSTQSQKGSLPCFWCNGNHRQPRQQYCPAFKKTCNTCGTIGHFARACRKRTGNRGRQQQQSNQIQDEQEEELFATDNGNIEIGSSTKSEIGNERGRKFFANLKLIDRDRERIMKTQIDSASTCNTISESMLKKLFPNSKISRTRATIQTYGSQTIKPKGKVTLCCEKGEKIHLIDFLVLDMPREKPPLLCGRDAQTLGYLKIYADEVHIVEKSNNLAEIPPLGQLTKEAVLQHYEEVFKPGRNKSLGTPLHIEVDPLVKPVHAPRRRVPVAKLDRVNNELRRLCDEGTIATVSQPTDWLSNMLVKEKPDGRIRLCIDPSQTINKAIKRPIYTIPTIEEQLPLLTKAKVFSTVDVSEAFHTIELDEASSLLTTFQGPNGRYRYTRMPFGISSGPEEYQRRQHEFLEGLKGVINIADDICIIGQGDTKEEADLDHDKNMVALLDKCNEFGLRLSAKKIQFKSKSVTFMGHKLTDKGVAPDPTKITAVKEMPRPTDKAGVLRFLGMCQYLSKFCKNLSEEVLPLRELTKQDVEFIWADAQETAFQSAKNLIASNTVLRYYDVNKPVTLQVDASEEAIGGALIQDGQPVCFTSHTLDSTERNYAQIEKECLAIVTCMNKWHHYLFGKKDILVHTDHQPLETIFKKPLCKAPRRLQRMMLKLQQYCFTVQYKRGKEMYIADTLSRAPLTKPTEAGTQKWEVFRIELATMDFKPPMISSGTFQRLQLETLKDPTLKALHKLVTKGWPSDKSTVPSEIRPFWSYRDEIATYDGVLVKAHQVIIPSILRPEMLEKIHKAHQGPESSIRRAREAMFWPGMQAAIRQTCLVCGTCAQYLTQRPAEPMQSHDIPELPWTKVSVDLFSFDGKDYLVTVDHYSDFFELDSLRNTTSNTVIRAMKRNFARLGIPLECVSDNGPQFISHEYDQFAKEYGFTLIKSSPYHSQGNGKAESAVKIAKTILKKARHEDPYLALLAYRNTPQQNYTYSPAQRLMSRKLRDILPTISTQLQPHPVPRNVVVKDIASRRTNSKLYYDRKVSRPLREFVRGEKVFVKPNPGNKHKPWVHGEVIDKPAPRSCLVQTPRGLVRRNHRQMRKAFVKPPNRYDTTENEDMEIESLPEVSLKPGSQSSTLIEMPGSEEPTAEPALQEEDAPLRRSRRQRRMPIRFQDYVVNA